MLTQNTDTCGFVPDTDGYLPCGRKKGHDGPCAHEISIFKTKVVITVKTTSDSRPGDADRFEIESDHPNLLIQTHDEKTGVNFVKGAILSALGELCREIPNHVIIDFVVKNND